MTKQGKFIAFILSGYALWNLFFLVQGKIPQSIFKCLTGLPCPSTGCTRSLKAMLQGQWKEAFMYNPLTLTYIFLLVFSSIWLAVCASKKRRLLLPAWLAWGWFVSLTLGWMLKFIIGPQYW